VGDSGSYGPNDNSDSTPFVNDQERGHHLRSAGRRGTRVRNTRRTDGTRRHLLPACHQPGISIAVFGLKAQMLLLVLLRCLGLH